MRTTEGRGLIAAASGAMFALVACGPRPSGGPSHDADPSGGDATTGSDATDASTIDAAIDAPINPAQCPIGPLDGCCPLLANGGSDPDCPSLSCDAFTVSQPIVLEELDDRNSEGAVGLAWTGDELVLARTRTAGTFQANDRRQEIVLERRNWDGALIAEHHIDDPFGHGGLGMPAAAASLAYEPVSNRLLFAQSERGRVMIAGLGRTGTVHWTDGGHDHCNGIDATVKAMAGGGRMLVSGHHYTCSGSTGPYYPYLTLYQPDGTVKFDHSVSDTMNGNGLDVGAACDRDCNRVLSVYYAREGRMRARTLEPATLSPTMTPTAAGGWLSGDVSFGGVDHTAVASNGSEWFAFYGVVLSSTGSTRLESPIWNGTAVIATGTPLGGQRALPPTAIWTGDGWLVAAATFSLSTTWAFPQDTTEYDVVLWHYAPDGTFREQKVLASEAYQPRLTWAGGRIAVTYIKVLAGREERRLVYLDCP